jgi:hypothetical protein
MVSERTKMKRSNTHRKFTTLYCDQSTQTQEGQDNSETEDSDFGPCLIGNSLPIMLRPSPVVLPSRYQAAARSQQQPIIVISSEESEEPPQCRQPNPGLGQTNIVNTVDATATVLHIKVVLYIPYA